MTNPNSKSGVYPCRPLPNYYIDNVTTSCILGPTFVLVYNKVMFFIFKHLAITTENILLRNNNSIVSYPILVKNSLTYFLNNLDLILFPIMLLNQIYSSSVSSVVVDF